MPEKHRFARIFVAKEVAQVLHDDVRVVISFHEPIIIVEEVFVNIVKRGLKKS